MNMVSIRNGIDLLLKSIFSGQLLESVEYRIEVLNPPHISGSLPPGKVAIYMFLFDGEFYKIGKAGRNSNSRFQYNHYRTDPTQSRLANSLLGDSVMKQSKNYTDSTISKWIRNNMWRINIYLDEKYDGVVLNCFEAVLLCKYKPKYERGSICVLSGE